MNVPIDLSIALSFFAFIAGGLAGLALRRREDTAIDLAPHIVETVDLVRQWEEPRLLTWTPELRARFYYQEECRRQIAAARRTA